VYLRGLILKRTKFAKLISPVKPDSASFSTEDYSQEVAFAWRSYMVRFGELQGKRKNIGRTGPDFQWM